MSTGLSVGVDGKKSPVNEVQAMQQQLQQILPQLGTMIEQVVKKQAEQDGMIAQNDASIKALTQAITKLSVATTKAATAPTSPSNGTPRCWHAWPSVRCSRPSRSRWSCRPTARFPLARRVRRSGWAGN